VLKLKAQNKKFNQFTQIDKFALIPKKWWEYFEIGENVLKINNTKTMVRVYEVPCTCTGNKHTHRILDLRSIWKKMNLSNHQKIEIEK